MSNSHVISYLNGINTLDHAFLIGVRAKEISSWGQKHLRYYDVYGPLQGHSLYADKRYAECLWD